MGIIQIGNTVKAPSFDDPIAMLLACHDKIRRFCQELDLLPEHIQTHGWNDVAKQSVVRIIHYFDHAAPLHHLDEERDLFPAYFPLAPEFERVIIKQLLSEHHQFEQLWLKLKNHLQSQDPAINSQLINEFIDAYTQHMALEEPLIKRAADALQDDVLQGLGANMANRRK